MVDELLLREAYWNSQSALKELANRQTGERKVARLQDNMEPLVEEDLDCRSQDLSRSCSLKRKNRHWESQELDLGRAQQS